MPTAGERKDVEYTVGGSAAAGFASRHCGGAGRTYLAIRRVNQRAPACCIDLMCAAVPFETPVAERRRPIVGKARDKCELSDGCRC